MRKQICRITIKGLVQGIGFRPFVAEMAEKFHIGGWVKNSDGIVTVLAVGEKEDLASFLTAVRVDAPDTARITEFVTEFEWQKDDENSDTDFQIVLSEREGRKLPWIPADFGTCERCKGELLDPNNRRYRHPFISCVSCGPRYSIIRDLPYDRESIVMNEFPMCESCAKEYIRKGYFRRHAQTICCNDCGPKLTFTRIGGEELANCDEIQKAGDLLLKGGILAVKDIGGYHLACDPGNERAVKQLRFMKHREGKPFAILFADVKQVMEFCEVNEKEKELLESSAKPIVLLKKALSKDIDDFCPDTCKGSYAIGAMLPCNPVQILLADMCGPLVMTSANGTGDLLITDNEKMYEWMKNAHEIVLSELGASVPLGILSNDREIRMPLDDSLVAVIRGKKQTIRRARGYVPEGIPVAFAKEGIFATGGDLKSSFCFAEEGKAYFGQHLGDLENEGSYNQFQVEYERMKNLFGFQPKQVVTDLHPGYGVRRLGMKIAEGLNLSKPMLSVSHHKAHVAAVLAEHNLMGTVLGFAFDGTGYGEDGEIWGGEVFLVQNDSNFLMERVEHCKSVEMLGGDEGARDGLKMLYGYIHSFSEENRLFALEFLKEQYGEAELVNYAVAEKAFAFYLNTTRSTSMGRLFDVAGTILGICCYNSYEGECAIALENAAAEISEREVAENLSAFVWSSWDFEPLLLLLMKEKQKGTSVKILARYFIESVAGLIVDTVRRYQVSQIALAGGTFCDRILLEKVEPLLEDMGVAVYRNECISPGDGGLALGQAYLAAKEYED